MKKMFSLLALSSLVLISCQEDDVVADDPIVQEDPVNYTSGSADFSTYVSIGNSLTAGFSDNALFISGQEASFPNMLASNFALAGGGAFTQPLMADNLGGLTLGGTPISGNRLILSFASGSPSPIPVSGQGSTEVSNNVGGPFNNMGVPGAKSYHLLAPGYGNVAGVAAGLANPYYARMATAADATVLGDAASVGATFFSLWIGNNDVLGYVVSGGSGIDQTGNLDPSTYGGSDISDPNVVAGSIDAIIQTMKANGAEGVIANIPDVLTIPYLNTVPHNPVPLDAATAALLNGAYASYNQALLAFATDQNPLGTPLISMEEAQQRTISFEAGETNAVVIIDEDLTDLTAISPALINMRQATAEDKLILPSSAFIGTLANEADPTSINGVAIPLADNWVLTPQEQETAASAVIAFNSAISNLATAYDLALVDANSLLLQLNSTGFIQADGSVVTGTFGTGGGFSLDGVHPSPRGYAIIANAFVEAINTKFQSNLPGVNPLDYTGLYLE